VPGRTPGFDGRREIAGAVVAYEVADRATGASALFAPVFADVTDALRAALGRSRIAFLDGSFWSDDELGEIGVPKRARSLGHLPVGGDDGSLARLGPFSAATNVLYAHVNNTSPLLDPASAASGAMRDAHADVADDGMQFEL